MGEQGNHKVFDIRKGGFDALAIEIFRLQVAQNPVYRDYVAALRINPATVAKAYQRLTDAGVLTVRRGDGTYVAEKPPAMSKAERARLLREAAVRYASLAATIGVNAEDAVDAVDAAWPKGEA